MNTKQCTKCKEVKALEDFQLDNSCKDGYRGWCRACMNKSSREYCATHKEEMAVNLRRWRKANPEKVRAQARKWRKANPEKARVRDRRDYQRRRARKAGALGFYTEAQWRALCARHNWKCLCCDESLEQIQARGDKMTVDHIVPLSTDGSDWIGNIQPLCLRCNARKGTKTIDYRGNK